MASPEIQKLIDKLRGHCTVILSKGNQSKMNYYNKMLGIQTLEELLQYKLPQVYEYLSPEERHAVSGNEAGNISFFEYLKILLDNLEAKLLDCLPPEHLKSLSIQELVNFAGGTPETSSIAPLEMSEHKSSPRMSRFSHHSAHPVEVRTVQV